MASSFQMVIGGFMGGSVGTAWHGMHKTEREPVQANKRAERRERRERESYCVEKQDEGAAQVGMEGKQ